MVIFNVTQYFSDKNGEFVFGPLCPDKFYEIQIWCDKVKHVKICDECSFEKRRCLKGTKLDPCKHNHFPCEPEFPCDCDCHK